MTDVHRRFLFEEMPVRGGWVRLDAACREILAQHDYPPVLRRMLGELLAATALLANNLKFRGSLIIQVQSPGPLQLLVVESTDQLGLRAIAKWQGELPDEADLLQLAGNGRCVITLDPKDGAQVYQGIVAMESGTIAEVLEHHMQRSEQLATRMWLAADGECAAGLLLQKLPGSGTDSGTGGEDWDRVTLLGSTVRAGELLGHQGTWSGDPAKPVGLHLHFSIVEGVDAGGGYANETAPANTYDPAPFLGVVRDGDGVLVCGVWEPDGGAVGDAVRHAASATSTAAAPGASAPTAGSQPPP